MHEAARTQCMAVLIACAGDAGPSIVTTGIYFDRWRKTAMGWQFAHRSFHIDGPLQ